MTLDDMIHAPFVWGLALGLLIAGFILKNAIGNRFRMSKEIKKLESELRDFQSHLNTQMKITATGSDSMTREIELLKVQNENLRVNLACVQSKPEKSEQRQFRIQEMAIGKMREQAPGFAGAWEKAVREAEVEILSAESGLTKLMRKVVPGLSSKPPVEPLPPESP
jgi:predicted  nucleic acid-binding Zn-ribbon protein